MGIKILPKKTGGLIKLLPLKKDTAITITPKTKQIIGAYPNQPTSAFTSKYQEPLYQSRKPSEQVNNISLGGLTQIGIAKTTPAFSDTILKKPALDYSQQNKFAVREAFEKSKTGQLIAQDISNRDKTLEKTSENPSIFGKFEKSRTEFYEPIGTSGKLSEVRVRDFVREFYNLLRPTKDDTINNLSLHKSSNNLSLDNFGNIVMSDPVTGEKTAMDAIPFGLTGDITKNAIRKIAKESDINKIFSILESIFTKKTNTELQKLSSILENESKVNNITKIIFNASKENAINTITRQDIIEITAGRLTSGEKYEAYQILTKTEADRKILSYIAKNQDIPNESTLTSIYKEVKDFFSGVEKTSKPVQTETKLLKYKPIEKPVVKPVEAPVQKSIVETSKTPLLKSGEESLLKEAKKYKSADEFVKAQGTPVYRGGIDLSKEKISGAGVSVSKGRNVAEDFVKQKGGKVEEILISLSAKIVDYSDVPNVKFKNLNDYSPELDTGNRQIWRDIEVEYQKAINWAKENGYDGVKLPLEGETRIISKDVLKTKSQLTDIWNNANKSVKKTKSLSGKEQLAIREQVKLDREITKIKKESLEFGDRELENQYQRFKKLVSPSKLSEIGDLEQLERKVKAPSQEIDNITYSQEKTGDEIFNMFKDRRFKELEALPKLPKITKAIISEQARSKIKSTKDILDRRRSFIRSVQKQFGLSDSDLKSITRKDIRLMKNKEFKEHLDYIRIKAGELEETRGVKNSITSIINEKELKKTENLRKAMELPPIHKMDITQLRSFERTLEQYKQGDEFLPTRIMQTIKNTEIAGSMTTREVLEILAKKSGKAVENMPIKITEFHRLLGDRRLGRQHPFLQFMVERKNRSLLEAESRIIELSNELNDLIRKARKSRKTTTLNKLIPTDENIVLWSETLDKQTKVALEAKMTKEELAVVKRWDEIRKDYYNYLVNKHIEKKFSRFEGQYFPHVRRGFLESWKDDGMIKAFKEMRDKYKQDAFTMDILNEKTGEILPYEKWIGFAQFRSDKLIPTSNSARAFESYITALEKAKHLDEMTPEIMAYVHSLSPRNLSPLGVELDTSLKKFVKEYINANKGRVPRGFFNPGEKFDVVIRSLITLTRMLDLGWNFTTQLASPIGENLMTLTMLKPGAYKLAHIRILSKKGKQILKNYENFVGKTLWQELTRQSKGIGDKLMTGAFAIYHISTRQANGLFLLGKMTDVEFQAGKISSEKLAKLQLEMSKYRKVSGLESILGRTTEAEAVKQYKSWAIPIFTATAENSRELATIVRKDGVAKALSSDVGKELFYSIGIGSAIGLLTYSEYKRLSEKKQRTFMEDIVYKAMRDAVSIYGAFDPTMWSGVRVADFLEDLAKASLDLIKMERYKTKDGLKGVEGLKRTFKPSIIRQLEPREETNKTEQGLPSLPKLPKLPTLPKLPRL